jgi:sulfite exporter TauE/SafE
VYTALIAAARGGMGAESVLQGFFSGMGLMLSFGIGTVPALLLFGKLAGLGWLKSRQSIYRISSGLMVLVGIYFVIQGIRY